MSCLSQLSRQKRILRTKVPGSIQTILLRCQPLSKRFLLVGPHGPVDRSAFFSRGPVDRDAFLFFCDSKHAAGVCLGTIHARTHVQLGLSCQQLLLNVQHRLRFTMQHVHSHAENLGNECSDHAAALGAFGLVSNHNFSTRWAYPSFDSNLCYAICHNLGDVLEKLRDIRTDVYQLPSTRPGVRAGFHAVLRYVSLACTTFLLVVPRSFAWLNLLQFALLKIILCNGTVRRFVCFYRVEPCRPR